MSEADPADKGGTVPTSPSAGRSEHGAEPPPSTASDAFTTLPYPPPPRAETADSTPLPGQTFLGRYTVLGQLGQGSMGVVLSVYDARLDRRVPSS